MQLYARPIHVRLRFDTLALRTLSKDKNSRPSERLVEKKSKFIQTEKFFINARLRVLSRKQLRAWLIRTPHRKKYTALLPVKAMQKHIDVMSCPRERDRDKGGLNKVRVARTKMERVYIHACARAYREKTKLTNADDVLMHAAGGRGGITKVIRPSSGVAAPRCVGWALASLRAGERDSSECPGCGGSFIDLSSPRERERERET